VRSQPLAGCSARRPSGADKGSVFITGAASGIGSAATDRLARGGYRVFAGVHNDTGSLSGMAGVRTVPIDVTDPSSVTTAAKIVEEAAGPQGLRAIINNAGVIVQGPLELVPADDLRRQFDINTLGPAYVVQAFLPLLRTGHPRRRDRAGRHRHDHLRQGRNEHAERARGRRSGQGRPLP
jgi:NAD(P)-dependent dehydrogenase (short-subunit alcohol dehydrogenase family)